jgi:hypothetical protein
MLRRRSELTGGEGVEDNGAKPEHEALVVREKQVLIWKRLCVQGT